MSRRFIARKRKLEFSKEDLAIVNVRGRAPIAYGGFPQVLCGIQAAEDGRVGEFGTTQVHWDQLRWLDYLYLVPRPAFERTAS